MQKCKHRQNFRKKKLHAINLLEMEYYSEMVTMAVEWVKDAFEWRVWVRRNQCIDAWHYGTLQCTRVEVRYDSVSNLNDRRKQIYFILISNTNDRLIKSGLIDVLTNFGAPKLFEKLKSISSMQPKANGERGVENWILNKIAICKCRVQKKVNGS